ncbi:uncharacterized protein LOC143376448 [Andrena cerasifolii]|uniref:uncharacterized protein LOC143376448 n=1 Tax=Andrena cerasifolii TaxID=2819439 RepID=UPI0040379FDB
MATLDMQQTVLNQPPGSEQPQEEVQLTELLPVKQSRMRENGIFKNVDVDVDADVDDAGGTDALKVLRSFTTEEEQFQLRNLAFCGKIERQARQERQGRKQSRKKTDGCRSERIDGMLFEGGAIKRKLKCVVGKSVARAKSLLKKNSMGVKEAGKGADADAGEEPSKRRTIEGSVFGKGLKDAFSGYNEEDTYLDLDKSKDLNDEIYVFRREPLDPSTTLDAAQERNASPRSLNGSYEDDCSSGDDAMFDPAISSQGTSEDESMDGDESDPGKKPKLEDPVNEASLNVGAIIEANYLFESENNNVLLRSGPKVQGGVRSGSPRSDDASKKDETVDKEDSCDLEGLSANSNDSQQKKYCCVVCEARFKGSGGLRNHYKIVHGAGPVFKCDECGKEFPLKERLKLHVRTHTGFKPYKCPECDKSFARGGQLVQHRRTHSQVKPYRCALCSGTFTCAANLALHVKRHNGQKDHKCEICGRAFVRRDALKKHLECLHRDVKSFLCVICNKTFKGHLPQHMRTHARDRPHGCATCGQRFAQKSQLTVHQRTHSGQRPFRCLVCWQAFAHSTALKLHTRRHTGERPFKCAECNAGFTQLPHWKKHMKCIHGRNEPYDCKKCKSFFRIKNDLECHEKTCHPELRPSSADGSSNSDSAANEVAVSEKPLPSPSKYKVMTVERMRLLLAVLLKRISKQERLDELGFGKRLIDEVLHDSLMSAGKDPVPSDGLTELESLTKNLEVFLKWTVPKEHWQNFRKLNKSPEDILETLTAT